MIIFNYKCFVFAIKSFFLVTIHKSTDYKMEAFPMTLVHYFFETSGRHLHTLQNFTLIISLHFLPLEFEPYPFSICVQFFIQIIQFFY